MVERSLRTRLKDSSGRNYADALAWGSRWESLRWHWFNNQNRRAEADSVAARIQLIEDEYFFETGARLYG